MSGKKFSWKERANSFGYAWQGIKALFRTEHNAWIHAGLTVAALFLSLIFRISKTEWIVLTIAMSLVWVTEILNTAIEKLADFITKKKHPQIGLVKDLAAAAVLISAVAALAVGGVIFIPKILSYVQGLAK